MVVSTKSGISTKALATATQNRVKLRTVVGGASGADALEAAALDSLAAANNQGGIVSEKTGMKWLKCGLEVDSLDVYKKQKRTAWTKEKLNHMA